MDYDGKYTPPPPADPIAGVTLKRLFEVSLDERHATFEFAFWRQSGALDHVEVISIKAEEFETFAKALYPNDGFGKACVAALAYRLQGVEPLFKIATDPLPIK